MRTLMRVGMMMVFFWFVAPVSAVTCPEEGDWNIVGGICVPADTGLAETSVSDILLNLMNWLLAILGFIGIIAFVISGLQYLTAAGDEHTIETAKTNMKYSVIGIVVALSGYIVIQAVEGVLSATANF